MCTQRKRGKGQSLILRHVHFIDAVLLRIIAVLGRLVVLNVLRNLNFEIDVEIFSRSDVGRFRSCAICCDQPSHPSSQISWMCMGLRKSREPLLNFTLTVKICPGDTAVRASCSCGSVPSGPINGSAVASRDTLAARLNAVWSCSDFSFNRARTSSFAALLTLVRFSSRVASSSDTRADMSAWVAALRSFSALFVSLPDILRNPS